MHSLRCSRWRHRCWEGAKLSRLRFQSASTALPWNGRRHWRLPGGCRHRKESAGRDGSAATNRGMKRRLYRAARHVSFFLIIIFNPIHCTVQQFALTPTYEILQGSLSDESIRDAVDSFLLLILKTFATLRVACISRSPSHNFFRIYILVNLN